MGGNKVTYTVTVDEELFPHQPGSEVVVRNLPRMHHPDNKWEKAIFVCREGAGLNHCFIDEHGDKYLESFTECYPTTTHGHLLGTTLPANTPNPSGDTHDRN